jgi:hypothetical protein
MHLKPDRGKITQEHVISDGYRSVDHLLDTSLISLPPDQRNGDSSRRSAIERMMAFGQRHRLNLGEQITRELFNEGHPG